MWLLILCVLLVAGSFGVRYWRRGITSAVTKKLSKSWSSAAFWFGIVGAVLVVCRVEEIQYAAMRFWWVVWTVSLVTYALFQWRMFTQRNYTILPKMKKEDPRDRYLPGKKKR
jgi:hypothetical protein